MEHIFTVDTRDLIKDYLDENPYANPSHRILSRLAWEVSRVANEFGRKGRIVTRTEVFGNAFRYEVRMDVEEHSRETFG